MPTLKDRIHNQLAGPVIPIEISISSEAEAIFSDNHIPVPTRLNVLALLDTGAYRSIIQTGVIAPLNLNPVGTMAAITASDKQPIHYPAYRIKIKLMENTAFDVTVGEMPLQLGQGVTFIIGRDILSHATFTYDDLGNVFTLTF